MRAIIINDTDARALLDQLKLEKFKDHFVKLYDIEDKRVLQKSITESVHSSFHFIVTRWLQEQGASIIR